MNYLLCAHGLVHGGQDTAGGLRPLDRQGQDDRRSQPVTGPFLKRLQRAISLDMRQQRGPKGRLFCRSMLSDALRDLLTIIQKATPLTLVGPINKFRFSAKHLLCIFYRFASVLIGWSID